MPTPDRRALRRPAAAGAILLIVATVAVASTYTPLFAARDIRIVGTSIARAELLAIASLDRGSNVFHLDDGAVERRLETDPRILHATVTTSLPDTIRIAVTPRDPVAVTGDPPILVGPDGVAIGPASPATDGLPRLRGADRAAGAAAAAAMTPALRRVARSIVVRHDGGISVTLEVGFSADLGDRSDLAAKAASLEAVLDWAASAGAPIVSADVTVPGSPTVRLEEGRTIAPPE